MILAALTIIAAYLLGSINCAILVCRALSLPDPRSEGSGNPGATNVLRLGGKKAAAITLAGDTLKGLIPVLIAKALGLSDLAIILTGLAAFFGHLYPVFFQFQGGKGVATAFGVFIGVSWVLGLTLLATWFVVAKLFRVSSLAALTAAALAPIYTWFILADGGYVLMMVCCSSILIWRHRSNIQRLFSGEEGDFKEKS